MLSLIRRGRAGHAVGARPMSLLVKASPTVQRLIRAAGLESYPLKGTGPKGIVTEGDVSTAKAAKAEQDEAARQPVTIELKPLIAHNLDQSALPTSAVTNKAELMKYYETMCAHGPT
jgi:pyruvate/2-oxoglutarate dehydrogenase complex dihydrolipoamide acyltransferase (E2) component